MNDSLSLLEKQRTILKDDIINDESTLLHMGLKRSREWKACLACIILAGIILVLFFLVPNFVPKKDEHPDNPMLDLMLTAASLVAVAKYFFLVVAVVLAFIAFKNYLQTRSSADVTSGIQGSYSEVEHVIQERILRKKKEVSEIDARIRDLKKVEEDRKKKVEERNKGEGQRELLQADLSGIQKTREGDYYMNLEDVWKELEEEEKRQDG